MLRRQSPCLPSCLCVVLCRRLSLLLRCGRSLGGRLRSLLRRRRRAAAAAKQPAQPPLLLLLLRLRLQCRSCCCARMFRSGRRLLHIAVCHSCSAATVASR